jgi:Fe-S oxidoreductase
MLLVGLGIFARTMSRRFALLKATRPEQRWDLVAERARKLLSVGILQEKMFKEPVSGLLHAFTFWGFLVLGLRTTQLFVQAFALDWPLPLIEGIYAPLKDFTVVVVLLAILGFFWRRLVSQPKRIAYSGEALLILGFIGGLMVTELLFEGMHFGGLMKAGDPDAADHVAHAPVGKLLANAFAASGIDAGTLHLWGEVNYWVHLAIVLTFMNLLPLSKHFHVITSLPNVFLSKLEPAGALSFVADIETKLENEEPLGLSKTEDLTWKQTLDLFTCTECGRCEVNCPAWNTGKPLNPKMIILDTRDHAYADTERLIAKAPAPEVPEGALPPLIAALNPDAIWSCTTCRSCSEQCPVMIEHVDKILDVRRHLVMTRNEFSKEIGNTLKNLENKSNPWGMAAGKRGDWAKDLGIPTLADNPNPEWLYFVGCAGAFDDRGQKIAVSVAKILKYAGVSFAIIGKKEKCSGDIARRVGHEYLFQEQAKENIETMKEGGVRKVIASCPHCFNTLKNEYPQLGGEFEVVHHTEFIDRLMTEGKLTLAQGAEQKIVFHDSCYLGRYNDVYDAPRSALQRIPGVQLVEMERSKKLGMCCGAGGGKMWMEEKIGKRMNILRTEQALETQPEVIASACPFCMTMLSDGVKAKEAPVQTFDIAELVAQRLAEKPAPITPASETAPPPAA